MKQFFQWMNQDENIRSAVAAFSQPGCHSIYGLSGSVKSALVAKALTEKPGQAVLVVPSREQAAAWMADLAFLVPDLPVLDFPVVDKAVFTTTAKSLDRTARQMEALGRLRQGDRLLILAAPEEAAQYVMAPQRIDAAAIDVAIHQDYDRDELLQHLVDAGYERVDMVERRGHFSVRGDIVDIYAVNEPQPLRLEFFGDELDSLRTFDTDSQKSQDQREKARILPISLTVQDDEKYTLLDYAGQGVIIWDEPNRVREGLKKVLKESDDYKGRLASWKNLVTAQRPGPQLILSLMAQSVPDMMIDTSASFAAKMMASFQKQFNLTADGVVGRSTWYKISYIYVSVKDLAELTSEGETFSGTLPDSSWNFGSSVLKQGSTGSEVEQVQFWLSTLAQYESSIPSVTVDGVYGSGTAAAVRAFQRLYGLTVDGIVGLTTWTELYDQFRSIQSDNGTPNAYPGTALRQGSSGQNVRLVQFWLKIARTVYSSLNNVTVDGIFGSSTAAAVRRFQTYFGLTSDGVVGRTTWNKLYEVYNDIANRLLSPSLRPGEYPGVLRNGSTGTAVRELQFYLYLMSAYQSSIPSVSIDGRFGAATEAAVRAYQRFAGLTVDGIVGRKTWDSLYGKASALRSSGPVVTLKRLPYPGTPLTVGTDSSAVLYYTLLLQRIAYYYDSVASPALSSQYTQETADATASAQELLGLPATGVADAETWTSVEALSLQLAAFTPNPDRHPEQGPDYPDRAMKEGSAGPDVSLIEGWLNDRSQLYCEEDYVPDNAVFGPEDTAAVKDTQQRAGLEPNGVVDRPTWAALRAQSHTACDNCTEEG